MSADEVLALAAAVEEVDGVSPLNEASRIALTGTTPPRIDRRRHDDDSLVGIAYAAGDSHVEVFVHPRVRGRGIGRELLTTATEAGEQDFWAHGDLESAQNLASSLGLDRTRTLLILSRSVDTPLPDERDVPGVTLRTWRDADAPGLVAVNAIAFADHPEQSGMDEADLRSRMAQPWFDPTGLFVAERDGAVVGFHWTKIEDGVGEVYVVGVDPSAQGIGLGRALTLRGLHHLAAAGVSHIDLYVEGDNAPALATYHGLDFAERARDSVYSTRESPIVAEESPIVTQESMLDR